MQTNNSKPLVQALQEQINARLLELIQPYREPDLLYDPIEYVLRGDGKRIRPLLLLLVCDAYQISAEKAIDVAAALEILHNFTLVHDDIMDGDEQRRGRPTVHAKWDISTGILSGDGLLALAYKVLLQTNLPEKDILLDIFTDGVIDICEGQAYDKMFEKRMDISIDDYLMMVGKKTGRLTEMCCHIGGKVAEVSPDEISILRKFGFLLGQAFQVQDDLLEVTSTAEITGKSLGSDLFAHKKTFVLIKALELADESRRKEILRLLQLPDPSGEDFMCLKQVMDDLGVFTVAESFVTDQIDQARSHLDELPVETRHLEYLTNKLLNRKA